MRSARAVGVVAALMAGAVSACGSSDADSAAAPSSAGPGGAGAGGPSGGGGSSGAGGGVPEECVALGAAVCARLDECSPASVILPYGTVETCQAREARRCASALALADTGYSVGSAVACTAAYRAATCDGVITAVAPACAPGGGTRAVGQPCASPDQCQSGHCAALPATGAGGGGGAAEAPSGCGVCAPRADIGQSCADDAAACVAGSACVAGVCVALATFASSCAAGEPCDLGLVCDGTLCVPGGAAGATCDAMTPCDPGAALGCAAGVCAAPVWAEGGQPCLAAIDGEPVPVCIASSHCGGGGICVAAAEDGAACGGAPGVSCYPPAVCSGGFCTSPDAMQCD
jgi:hypothetical protein